MFIMHALVKKLVRMGAVSASRQLWSYLYLMAYVCLLRLPSEALPMAAHALPSGSVAVPVLTVGDAEIAVWFPKRKNRLHPSTLKRKCWCRSCKASCPAHVLGAFFGGLAKGAQPFAMFSAGEVQRGLRAISFDLFSAGEALRELRLMLAALDVKDAGSYRTHDLRRGHAEDMRRNGATLGEILLAGDWRSPSFLSYLDRVQLEQDRTAEAHWYDSSEEER